MNRHWTVSIDGGAPVHLDLAQYAAAIERAKQEGKPGRVMIEANPKQTMINWVPQCVVGRGHYDLRPCANGELEPLDTFISGQTCCHPAW
jgi:hypothetical protein